MLRYACACACAWIALGGVSLHSCWQDAMSASKEEGACDASSLLVFPPCMHSLTSTHTHTLTYIWYGVVCYWEPCLSSTSTGKITCADLQAVRSYIFLTTSLACAYRAHPPPDKYALLLLPYSCVFAFADVRTSRRSRRRS